MPCKDPDERKKKDKERYCWRKEHNICVLCGKKQTDGNHIYCLECREKRNKANKETYYWLKQHHICVLCRQNPAEKNRVYCYECNMKRFEINRQYRGNMTDEQKKALNERIQNWRKERKENGLCVICGRSTNNNGKTVCNECRIKQNRWQNEKRRREGKISWQERGNGIYCYHCCKPVENKGNKLCESCKKKASEHMNNIRLQYQEQHGNPFKRLNNAFWEGFKK